MMLSLCHGERCDGAEDESEPHKEERRRCWLDLRKVKEPAAGHDLPVASSASQLAIKDERALISYQACVDGVDHAARQVCCPCASSPTVKRLSHATRASQSDVHQPYTLKMWPRSTLSAVWMKTLIEDRVS